MVLGWVGILVLAIIVFRVAGHVEKKVRSFSVRPRRHEDTAA